MYNIHECTCTFNIRIITVCMEYNYKCIIYMNVHVLANESMHIHVHVDICTCTCEFQQ